MVLASVYSGLLLFCLYQLLIEIVVIHISWTGGVMLLHWSGQFCRDTLRRRINQGAPVSTLPLLCQGFLWIFFWIVKFNHGIGSADLHYRDVYYMIFSIHLICRHFCILEYLLWDRVVNNTIPIFPFNRFEQILSLGVICVIQLNNIFLCRWFRKSSPIGIELFANFDQRYQQLPYCIHILFLSK